MVKKILITGNSAKEHALVKRLTNEGYEVHVASGNDGIREFAICADIRQDAGSELVNYVMENDINLVIPFSDISLKSKLTDMFKKNNVSVFAPSNNICELLYDKGNLKKLLYRLKISTPKFGIFEKPAMAFEYIKKMDIPFVIKTTGFSHAVVLTSDKTAKNIVNSCFDEQSQKIIIEDYIFGTPFCFYVITDGYKALSIGSSQLYQYSLDGDGGQLTNGMGTCSPFSNLTNENEQFILTKIINKLLEYFQSLGTPYLGILGIEAILTPDNHISVIGVRPFMQDSDCQAILNNINMDLYRLFESCINGSFSDDIDEILLKDIYSTSVTLNCTNKNNNFNSITGLETVDEDANINFYSAVCKNKYMEFEAQHGQNLVVTCSAGTSAYATGKVYDEIKNINFLGKYYRTDIGKSKQNYEIQYLQNLIF